MSVLEKLRACSGRQELAQILGYSSKSLTSIAYGLKGQNRYTEAKIPKKAKNEYRTIHIPNPKLKLLQRRVANLLNACLKEIDSNKKNTASHAFLSGKSIVTNAKKHTRKRYVLNIDLEDFFPSINPGRVMGILQKNHAFQLQPEVAKTIAKIACHENGLPQGSPCSPVISELITRILDRRLITLSKKYKLIYTRYADDITLSTNQKSFPKLIAEETDPSKGTWEAGQKLTKIISKSGFNINKNKTRMQIKTRKQSVTGLSVNSKANIESNYYRTARAMAHRLFSRGEYLAKNENKARSAADLTLPAKERLHNLRKIRGIISHIDFVKRQSDPRNEASQNEQPTATRELYNRTLVYFYFAAHPTPLVICEGPTDSVYLKKAIKVTKSEIAETGLDFFSYAKKDKKSHVHSKHILKITGGAPTLIRALKNREEKLEKIHTRPFPEAVIFLVDNDAGAKSLCNFVNNQYKTNIPTKGPDEDFYHITDNVYIIKTPIISGKDETCIEDLFSEEIQNVFHNTPGDTKAHSGSPTTKKKMFAEKVRSNFNEAEQFRNFGILLDRIQAAINDYRTKRSKESDA